MAKRLGKWWRMSHKFRVGEFVYFKPVGAKEVGRFKILLRMPEEFRAAGWQYRVKSDQEGFQRTVYEWDLTPSIVPQVTPKPVMSLKRVGRRS